MVKNNQLNQSEKKEIQCLIKVMAVVQYVII